MFLIYNPGILRIFHHIHRVLAAHFLLHPGYQFIFYRILHQQVIRRNAGLASVQALAPDNPPGRQRKVGGFLHDTGAFSSQLQSYRRQVFRGGSQDDLAHPGAAGKKDMVKGHGKQPGVMRNGPQHRRNIFLREALPDHLGQNRRRCRGVRGQG